MNPVANLPVSGRRELERHAVLVLGTLASALVLLAAWLDFRAGLTLVAAAVGVGALGLGVVVVYTFRGGSPRIAMTIGIFIGLGVMVYSGMSRDESAEAMTWAPVFPPLAYFFLGLRRGTLLSAAVLLLAAGVLFGLNPGEQWRISVSILMSYVVVVAGSLLYERARSRIERQLERMSATDHLTGAFNRHKFQEVLPAEIERAQRYGQPLSLVMIDLNGFKSVNDRHGHAVGDQVLVKVAGIIAEGIRVHDFLLRYGGDEFVVLAPSTDAERADEMCHKICRAIADGQYAGGLKISASGGVAELAPGDTAEQFITRADRALYGTKRGQ